MSCGGIARSCLRRLWLPTDEQSELPFAPEQAKRLGRDPWIESLADQLRDVYEVTGADCLRLLSVPVDRQGQSQLQRVGRCMQKLKCSPSLWRVLHAFPHCFADVQLAPSCRFDHRNLFSPVPTAVVLQELVQRASIPRRRPVARQARASRRTRYALPPRSTG
jgi:hypothetical protein